MRTAGMWYSHDGQDLEEIVLGKVLMGMMLVQGPEVVDKEIEDAQDDNEHDGTELGLEANDDHDAGHKANDADDHTTDAPFAGKDEPDEEEDEKHAACELEVHLAILLVDLGQARWREALADPTIGQDHQESPHDRQIAEKEVEVKDESIAKRLGDDHTKQAKDGKVGMFA